jgi:hypothetical protein
VRQLAQKEPALGWSFGTDLSLSRDPLLGHGSLGLLYAEQNPCVGTNRWWRPRTYGDVGVGAR